MWEISRDEPPSVGSLLVRWRTLAARAAAGIAVVAGLVVVSATPAAAHAELIDASPRPGSGLAQAPADVVIRFSERVNLDLSRIEILADDGQDQGVGPTVAVEGDAAAIRRKVGLLPPGRYVVRWRSTSPFDGHALSGSFAFGVGTAVNGAEVVNTGPIESEGWPGLGGQLVALLGLALWAGSAIGRSAAHRAGAAARASTRLRRGALAGVIVGTVTVVMSSVLTGGGGLADLDDGFLTSQSGRLRLVVVTVAALTLVVPSRLAVVDIGLAGGALLAQAASGHAASAPIPWLAILVFAVHLGAVGVWLHALATAVAAAGRVREVLRAFAPAAVVAAAVVGLTGASSAAIELSRPADLVATGYGRVILVKSGLFALMLVFGVAHRNARARPARSLRTVRRPVLAELAAGATAVAFAALLVAFPNPPREAEAAERRTNPDSPLLAVSQEPAVTVAAADGPFVVGVAVTPPRPGNVRIRVLVSGTEPGDGLRDAKVVASTGAGDRREAALTGCGVGCFEGDANLDRASDWRLAPTLTSNRGPIAVEVDISLPAADGRDRLAATLRAMEALVSVSTVETLRAAEDTAPIVTRYEFSAPDAMRFTLPDGSGTVALGRDRYTRDGGDPWERGRWPDPGFAWPQDFYREFWADAAAVRVLATERIDGEQFHVVGFVRPELSAWFRLWIGTDDNLVHRLEMRTEGHLMDQTLSDFNAPIRVELPAD